MAEPTPANPDTVHPDVRYEHSDVAPRGVVIFAGILVAVLVVCGVFLHVLFFYFLRVEQKAKETDLPAAAVDADRLPPAPRLEGIEEAGEGKFTFYPPRAEEYLLPEEKRLAEGGKGEVPIGTAIDALAGKLPVEAKRKAPLGALPSKASAGRTSTGGR
jgi:hypothetical protein